MFTPLLAAHGLAVIQIVAVNRFFVLKAVNGMNTELIAGMVLVWLGVVLLMASRWRSWRWLLVSGVVFGIAGFDESDWGLCGLACFAADRLCHRGVQQALLDFVSGNLVWFLITVTPWLVRNQVIFFQACDCSGRG